MKNNCKTCQFAKRDEFNRFSNKCEDPENCDYQEFYGKITDVITLNIMKEDLTLIKDILERTNTYCCSDEKLDGIIYMLIDALKEDDEY